MFIIIVDMDQVGVEDPMQAADNLISKSDICSSYQ